MDASAALDTALEVGKLLDCGLDRETLSVCIALIEAGVSPEVLMAAAGATGPALALARLFLVSRHLARGLLAALPAAPQALAVVVSKLRQQAAQQQQAGAGGGAAHRAEAPLVESRLPLPRLHASRRPRPALNS